jgi:hypothetical protein
VQFHPTLCKDTPIDGICREKNQERKEKIKQIAGLSESEIAKIRHFVKISLSSQGIICWLLSLISLPLD